MDGSVFMCPAHPAPKRTDLLAVKMQLPPVVPLAYLTIEYPTLAQTRRLTSFRDQAQDVAEQIYRAARPFDQPRYCRRRIGDWGKSKCRLRF